MGDEMERSRRGLGTRPALSGHNCPRAATSLGVSWPWSLLRTREAQASAPALGQAAAAGPPPLPPQGARRSRPLRSRPVRRKHHDRVLHDGADAGLGRGLLHLQPHAGRPQQLPPSRRRQRLPPRRPLSQARAPSPAQGGPPGPPPHPCRSACGGPRPPPRAHDATLSRPSRHHSSPRVLPRSWMPGGVAATRVPPALWSVSRLTPAPAGSGGPGALWGHSQLSPFGRADHPPVSPPGDGHLGLLGGPHGLDYTVAAQHLTQHFLHWGPLPTRSPRRPPPSARP